MKRAIAILVAVLYIIPTIGYSMDIHWCGKRISSVNFNSVNQPKCGTCKTVKRCCKTTHTVVKLKDNQHNSSGTRVVSQAFVQTIAYPLCTCNPFPSEPKALEHIRGHSPPVNKQLVYLSNSVFRV